MNRDVASAPKIQGTIVEYLDQGRFRAGVAVREQDRHVAIVGADGRERLVARDLVMISYPGRRPAREKAAEALAALEAERVALARELDLNLLWEVVQEQGRSFTAPVLAELFFGARSEVGASVMLEALLGDRTYFIRRHMEFVARAPDQVERLRIQQDRARSRSEDYRRTQQVLRDVVHEGAAPAPAEASPVVAALTDYLKNPFTRSRELTQMLQQVAPEVDPAEAAFEILDRLGHKPDAPRFAFIAGLRNEFSAEVLAEGEAVAPPPRTASGGGFAITIDDDDTVEVDDAIACEETADGALRVRVHIALVADFVPKGGPMDREAAARATTVYLPETTVRMLPDRISCDLASLLAGHERHVLTTDATISPQGEIISASIYPARIPIVRRLSYDEADRLLAGGDDGSAPKPARSLRLLHDAAMALRRRRRIAGALLIHRRETKVRVRDDTVEIRVQDTDSPARILVGELMVLSNFVAARYAAENRIPIIFRVQPDTRGDFAAQRPRLSLYPEYHAGIGLDYYAQLSSPIRRYADLVMQRQLVGALTDDGSKVYNVDELLAVLATAENAEASGRELERRAKRYWILRHLDRHQRDRPLAALATRDGAGAELTDFGVRGTLHGAPTLPDQAPIIVQLSRVDPLRGWLSFDFLGMAERTIEGVR
jgi:exoribonuclease II